MRSGPGKEFPVKFELKQKGYPLKIIAEYNNWRKVKTFNDKIEELEKQISQIQESSEDRGPNDLTLMIERLEKENKEIKRKLKNVERMIYEDWKRRFFNK